VADHGVPAGVCAAGIVAVTAAPAADIAVPADADSVYFLMFTGWETELRSNRWHFASRWARHLPVVLVQPTNPGLRGVKAHAEPRIPNCEILKIAGSVTETLYLRRALAQTAQLLEHMQRRGHARPILWCYNPRLAGPYAAIPAVARVFHATENYADFDSLPEFFYTELQATLEASDLVVAVSPGVEASVAPHVTRDRLILVTNGCDTRAYSPDGPADHELSAAASSFDRTAIYAGNVNGRLDFRLLAEVASANPTTLVAIFGPVSDLDPGDAGAWNDLLRFPNVRHFGPVDPNRLPGLYRAADLGLIPYKRAVSLVRNGFPLKALEMCATGLPAVSSLMEPLVGLSSALVVAEDDIAFLAAFAELSRSSMTAQQREELTALAARNDYDLKFAEIVAALRPFARVGQPETRLDPLVSRIGLESWEDALTLRGTTLAAQCFAAVAGPLYSATGNLLPASVRHAIPETLRDRVRRRVTI
jgi:hypothetical protein